MKNQITKLAMILGMGALTGVVSVAAASGLFKPENAPTLAFAFMAGPGAIITATLLDGNVKERMFSALFAGIIATMIVIVAAGLGPKLLGFVNLNIIKIFGAISIFTIALMIAGLKISNLIPLIIIGIGIIVGVILR